MNFEKDYNNILETLSTIFTVKDGDVKVLLMRKKMDPYKGYWILPGEYLKNNESLEDCITDAIIDKLGLSSIYLEQVNAYSAIDRNPLGRIIAVNFLGLIDSITIKLKRNENSDYETNWFSVDSIPKMGYDHEHILNKSIEFLKKKIYDFNVLKYLFPCDFTLPEIQGVYEQLMKIKIDRRNFRKKILNSNLIESTGEKNEGFMGRPANLYRFKIANGENNIILESE